MSSIPIDALKFGAESINQNPISYGKSRISGSLQVTYILHVRGGCMPGQPNLFTTNHLSQPPMDTAIFNNRFIRAFSIKNKASACLPLGPKHAKTCIDLYTYDQYSPNDDEAFTIAVKASYRQVYGNFNAMESERPRDLERRLRNGDIPIREFIRQLAKSPFYRSHYFDFVNQQRCIELSFKHILGRPPVNQLELINHVELINNEGFENHIDALIDSDEYNQIFGEHTVPYLRCWNSPCGLPTSSFNNSAALVRSFATSDNAIHWRQTSPKAKSGKSQILENLASMQNLRIKIPTHAKSELKQEKTSQDFSLGQLKE